MGWVSLKLEIICEKKTSDGMNLLTAYFQRYTVQLEAHTAPHWVLLLPLRMHCFFKANRSQRYTLCSSLQPTQCFSEVVSPKVHSVTRYTA